MGVPYKLSHSDAKDKLLALGLLIAARKGLEGVCLWEGEKAQQCADLASLSEYYALPPGSRQDADLFIFGGQTYLEHMLSCVECCAVLTRPSGENRSTENYRQLFIDGWSQLNPGVVN
ncbi:hypothetical protein HY642_03960 [Candidatus Woesearchaeota archaeon]|nr:hypothetical protein [Candidatus Woesearchaeota archaeon]